MADGTPTKFVFDCETGLGSYDPLADGELTQYAADQRGAAATATAASANAAAANEQGLLAKRNRWLFETDPYNLAPDGVSDIPAAVSIAVTDNGDAIRAWRQALRDYPDTVTDWNDPPPLPEPPNVTLPTGKPLFRLT